MSDVLLDAVNNADALKGAAAMDPASAAWITAGSNVLGRMLSPGGAPSYSTSSANPYQAFTFDNSGFNVALGKGATATSTKLAGLSPWIVGGGIFAAGLVGLAAIKHIWPKKSS